MKYNSIEDYVREHGYDVSDLTKAELKEAKKEMEAANRGEPVLDGIFSDYTILARKTLQ